MNREFLKSLGIEDENINKIMAEYGKDVNEYKAKADTLDDVKSQLDTANRRITQITRSYKRLLRNTRQLLRNKKKNTRKH